MRFSAITSVLLLGVTVVSALPTEMPETEVDMDFGVLDARGLRIGYLSDPQTQEVCPATNNGPNRNYGEHTYSKDKVEAAYRKAVQLQADDKQIGANHYPHDFGNKEKLEFDCGKNKKEFPILTNGDLYDGGETTDVPDRVVYEYKEDKKKNTLAVKFCGVIRHGPTPKFINCHK